MQSSLSLRASRTFIALLTVWCLGCSAFEPILATLMDRATGVACEGTAMMGEPEGENTNSAALDGEPEQASGPSVGAIEDNASMDCGCAQACVAASPLSAVAYASPAVTPFVASVDAFELPSVDRRPLIPPPERTTA